MRVKIGNTIYSSESQPIMIILNYTDKVNIKKMPANTHKYCAFPATFDDNMIRNWMASKTM